jgi:hypothetical protein
MNSASPLPEWVERVVEAMPPFSDKRALAKGFSQCFGPISYRTVEDRPFVWRLYNGRATTDTRAAFEDEYARFVAAPKYRVGRTKKTA